MPSLLLTGSSGFLGRILYGKLAEQFELVTLGRRRGNLITTDLAQEIPVLDRPFDVVVHNAGKAHTLPRNASEADWFFQVNHQGTLNLLAGLERAPALPGLFVFISTVAVYGVEDGEGIAETHPLAGKTPYAESKILAETAIWQWCKTHGVRCIILRLPLVTGPNPPGNLGAMIRAIQKGYYLAIRNNRAAKSMVAAKDVAELVARLDKSKAEGIYNLTDGVHPAFCEVEAALEQVCGRKIRWRIPLVVMQLPAKVGDVLQKIGLPAPLTSAKLRKMTLPLTFEDGKARREWGWNPEPALLALND